MEELGFVDDDVFKQLAHTGARVEVIPGAVVHDPSLVNMLVVSKRQNLQVKLVPRMVRCPKARSHLQKNSMGITREQSTKTPKDEIW